MDRNTRTRSATTFTILACAFGIAHADSTSVIKRVTVFSDRARVMREQSTVLDKGTTTLTFEKLPAWVDADSVRVSLLPAGQADVIDVNVDTTYFAKPDDAGVRKLSEEIMALEDQMQDLDDELTALTARREQLSQMRVFARTQLPEDAARGKLGLDDYKAVADYATSEHLESLRTQRRIERARRDLEAEFTARRKAYADQKRTAQLQKTTVKVMLKATAKGPLAVQLSYMVPGTTWAPMHELRASGSSPKSVTLITHAALSQATGEEWRGAEIFFSTQSPVETARIPEVEALFLDAAVPNPRRIKVGNSSGFSKAQQIYSSQIMVWNGLNTAPTEQQQFVDNQKMQAHRTLRNVATFSEIEKRGTTALFAGVGQPLVRSDGNTVRVPLGQVDLPAAVRLVAAPRVSLNAAVTAKLTHTGEQPVLPGKVAIYRDGAFMGQTEVDFVAVGETFSLYLGVADQIKLSRVLNRKTSTISRGRRTRLQVAFELEARNLGTDTVTLELADRIPISQNKDVRVSDIRVEPKCQPDASGGIRWMFELAPGTIRKGTVGYRLEYPPELLGPQLKQRHMNAAPAANDDMDMQIDMGDLMSIEEALF